MTSVPGASPVTTLRSGRLCSSTRGVRGRLLRLRKYSTSVSVICNARQHGDDEAQSSSGIGVLNALKRAAALGTVLRAAAHAQAFGRPAPSYDELTARRAGRGRPSSLPSSREAAALLQPEKQDLFTPDAWQGMLRISQYVEYVEGLEPVEEAEPACVDGRLQLEKAWQVVANEFYDPHGTFSQAAWAAQLHSTLLGAGGCLHSRADTYRALKAMMASLGDRYTEFLVPTRFRQALRRPQPAERDYLEAQATGVGLLVGEHASEGGWLVDGALAESPAEEAGFLQGDRITELDGYPTDALTRAEMTALLRGPSGSGVVLSVARPGLARPHAVYLERRALPQPPLKVARVLAGSAARPVAYVREHYVSSAATRDMAAALQAAEAEGCAGLILDARNNPGGVFEEAIAQASFFLEEGRPVVATVRNEEVVDNTWRAGRLSGEVFPGQPTRLTSLPLVLLVNSGTASAAEVLTGALHDSHRAVVVGQKTFGKGVVQYYFPMDDSGSGLKVTVAKYLTPGGYDITRQGGLQPDIVCNDFPHGGLPTATDDKCIATALKIIHSAAG